MADYNQFVLDEKAKKLVASIISSGKVDINTTEEVDVRGFATAQANGENVLPENIRKGVNILGVAGDFGEALTFEIMTVKCQVTLFRKIDDEWVDVSAGHDSGTVAYGAQYKAIVAATGSNTVKVFKANGQDLVITTNLEDATPIAVDLETGISILAIASGDDSSSSGDY